MDANLEATQEAMSDELFLADLREVMNDFGDADLEQLTARYADSIKVGLNSRSHPVDHSESTQ
jgi:hypothetical protein